MRSGRANLLTLRKNRYKNKHNLALGGQFWYQNHPFKQITIKWLEQKGIIFQDTSGTPQLNSHRSLGGGRVQLERFKNQKDMYPGGEDLTG